MTKDDPVRTPFRSYDQPNTSSNMFRDWNFETPVLPYILELFPMATQDPIRFKKKLLAELVKDLELPGFDAMEVPPKNRGDSEAAMISSMANVSQAEPPPVFRPILREIPAAPSYATGRWDSASSFANYDPLRFAEDRVMQPSWMENLDINGMDSYDRHFQTTSSEKRSRAQNADQQMSTPQLLQNSHPVLPAGPVQGAGRRSRNTLPHTIQNDVCFIFTIN
jgi:hypothetical protein